MDIKELQQLANIIGGVVVIENDQPAFVVLPYKKLFFNQEKPGVKPIAQGLVSEYSPEIEEEDKFDRLNKEILLLKDEIEKKEQELLG